MAKHIVFIIKRLKCLPVSTNQYAMDQLLMEIESSEFCAEKRSMNESNLVVSFDKGDVSL